MSNKCYVCQEKPCGNCLKCFKNVCIYHCSQRVRGFDKEILCDNCRSLEIEPEILLLKKSLVEKQQELKKIHSSLGTHSEKNLNLMLQEEELSKKIEEVKENHFENLQKKKNKLSLEEKSRNNLKHAIESMYNAIESQQSRIELLEEKLKEVNNELEFTNMVIEHQNFIIQQSLLEKDKKAKIENFEVEFNVIEKIICNDCKSKIFGSEKNFSVFSLSDIENKKACGSCYIF